MAKLSVGIIGYGLGGSVFHAPLISASEDFQLTAIATSRRELVEARYPDCHVYATPEALLADESLDAIVVVLPNHLHFQYCQQALKLGKHVVVDKPFTTSSKQCLELTRLAEAMNRKLSVFHNRRWDADFLTVQKLLEQNVLGEVSYFESHFDRYRPQVGGKWKEQIGEGGGAFFDLGSHLLDQVLMLFGDPLYIQADIAAQRIGAKNDDYFHVTLTYDKLRAVVCGSALASYNSPKYIIHGLKGSFVKHGIDPQEEALKSTHPKIGLTGWGEEAKENFGIIVGADGSKHTVISESGRYQEFYTQFAHAILANKTVPVQPTAATKVIRCIEIAQQSAREGKTLAYSL